MRKFFKMIIRHYYYLNSWIFLFNTNRKKYFWLQHCSFYFLFWIYEDDDMQAMSNILLENFFRKNKKKVMQNLLKKIAKQYVLKIILKLCSKKNSPFFFSLNFLLLLILIFSFFLSCHFSTPFSFIFFFSP